MLKIVAQYWPALSQGVLKTVQLAVLAWAVGLVAGMAMGYGGRNSTFGGYGIRSFSFALASIPVLAILFWVHYPLQHYLNATIDPFLTTAGVLSLVNAFLVASVIRQSARLIPRQFLDSARIYAVGRKKMFWRIEVPLIFRASISELLSLQVVILHMTLFGSLISVNELFRVAQRINSLEYRPVELYTLVAVFYLAISAPLNLAAIKARKKYQRDFSER